MIYKYTKFKYTSEELIYLHTSVHIIWTKITHSLKYLRSLTLKCKDIGIRKSEIVTKAQFLNLNSKLNC